MSIPVLRQAVGGDGLVNNGAIRAEILSALANLAAQAAAIRIDL